MDIGLFDGDDDAEIPRWRRWAGWFVLGLLMGGIGLGLLASVSTTDCTLGGEARYETGMLKRTVWMHAHSSAPPGLPETLESMTRGTSPVLGEIPEDPWDHRYVYRKINRRRFEIVSRGPDGELGTGDDIVRSGAYDPKDD